MTGIVSKIIQNHLLQYAHPIVDTKTLSLEFFEILSRAHYEGTIASPKDFMKEITAHQRFVIAQCVLEKIKLYQKQLPTISFSVNISSLEFELGLSEFLKALGSDRLIEPSRCIIEVSESLSTSEAVMTQMQELHTNFGFRFALDDFGAGFSTFEHLFRTNGLYEYVKIDGSMVTGLLNNEAKKSALIAMVYAIKKSNKKSIVEFVENEETFRIIRDEVGADFIQGYILGEPAPLSDSMHLLKENILKITNIS
ncbi:MAG: EAL domain-containing protein [Sulfurospirillum sp.]|nr:EAL domain-containing protein [Sulfurospirillum sp.]